jgi:SecD/SecF fusion protein
MRTLGLALTITLLASACASAPIPNNPAGPSPVTVECWTALRIAYELISVNGEPPTPDQIELAAAVVGARLAAAGVAPWDVQETADGLVVQLPITVEPGGVREFLIEQVGMVMFALIPEGVDAVQGDPLPAGSMPILGRGALKSATVTTSDDIHPAIEIELTPEAALAFANFTAANLGRQFAVAIDGVIYRAPVIMGKIDDGRMLSSGGLDGDQARFLADVLSLSVLPGALRETGFLSEGLPRGC